MIVKICKSEDPFARVPKKMLDDDRLSWKAKGILAYLLSKPNDWIVRVGDVIARANEGRDAVRAAFNELRDCGYAFLATTSDGSQWVVSDTPRARAIAENPSPENPSTENPCRTKNDETKNVRTHGEAFALESGEKSKPDKHRPPNEDAVVTFCRSVGLTTNDGNYFWNKWVGNGFKNNNKKMEDWRAVIRAHKAAGYAPSQRRYGANQKRVGQLGGRGTMLEGTAHRYAGIGKVSDVPDDERPPTEPNEK